jgi:hypothetical protein
MVTAKVGPPDGADHRWGLQSVRDRSIRGLEPPSGASERDGNRDYVRQQGELVGSVVRALTALRLILRSHPRARNEYSPPAWLEDVTSLGTRGVQRPGSARVSSAVRERDRSREAQMVSVVVSVLVSTPAKSDINGRDFWQIARSVNDLRTACRPLSPTQQAHESLLDRRRGAVVRSVVSMPRRLRGPGVRPRGGYAALRSAQSSVRAGSPHRHAEVLNKGRSSGISGAFSLSRGGSSAGVDRLGAPHRLGHPSAISCLTNATLTKGHRVRPGPLPLAIAASRGRPHGVSHY